VVLALVLALACAGPAAASDVYVTNRLSDNVSQYDVGAGGALVPKGIPAVLAGDGPVGVAISADGHSVYVPNSASNTVSQYDVGAGGALAAKSTPTVPAGAGPSLVAVSPDGHSVYVTNMGSDTVSQYDVGAGGALTAKSTPAVPAGDAPVGVVVRATPSAPPPATIGDLIASVEALALPPGIERSLLAKLTGAQRNLAADDLAGACGKLGALNNEVSAQSAKKIGAADAQKLIDQAREVRDSLGCGAD
jgi:YVTN family beta-propeller protein